jgi:hypothetical protein
VQGGNSDAVNKDNTAYAVANSDGLQVNVFGIEYSGSTLYGYSPDPDFVQSTVINATLNGDVGGSTAWSLLGGLGDDSIIGGANNDSAFGGVGNDDIFGGLGDDSLLGEDGDDTINGGDGNDDVYGGNNNDVIIGSLGADSLFGGDGNDDFQFANSDFGSAATIDGGAGTNTLSFTDAATVVDSQFANKSNIDVITTPDGFNSNLDLGSNAGSGSMGLNSVIGGTGNDTFGLSSSFTATGVSLYGGAGNDEFTVNSYSQLSSGYIDGGVGTNDTLEILTSYAGVAQYNTDSVSNIESLQLGNTAINQVILNNGAAGWGIATIAGGANVNNEISAFSLNAQVTLLGGNLQDELTGGNNNDRLQGWYGPAASANSNSDTLTGGNGSDVFVLGDGNSNAYNYNFIGSSGFVAEVRRFEYTGISTDSFELWNFDLVGPGVKGLVNTTPGSLYTANIDGTDVYQIHYNDAGALGNSGRISNNTDTITYATFTYDGSMSGNLTTTSFNFV